MKEGYIKLYRGIEDNDLWLQEPFTKGQAWIDILLLTNYKNGFILLKNGELVQIKRGDCGWSMEKLAKRWQWSRGKVKRFFNYLKTQKMIQQTDIPKATIINVCNYERFQNDTSNGHQTAQQTDTNNKGKKEKNTTTTYSDEIFQKIFGKYNNVCLTAEQYNRLLAMCASQKLLDELVDSLSANIETGKEQPFRADFPNAHFIRVQKYLEYRRKYPERFTSKPKQGNQSQTDEQEEIRKIAAEWAKRGNE